MDRAYIGCRGSISKLALMLIGFALGSGLSAMPAGAREPCAAAVARLVSLQGVVEIQRAGSEGWQAARLEEEICSGDHVRVRELSRAALAMPDETIVRLDQLTNVSLVPPPEGPNFLLELVQGAIHFFSRTRRALQVSTPFVNGVIEGTEVFMATGLLEDRVSVIEGALRIENRQGYFVLRSGESATVARDAAPVRDSRPAPLESIQWAIYYPPLFGFQSGAFAALTDRGLAVRLDEAVRRFQGGDVRGAFEALPTRTEDDDPALLALRASMFLYVGRVAEAIVEIGRLRRMPPDRPEAPALEAIIAAAQNRKTEALERGREALVAAPDSAPALVAFSIAQQASFDLDGARQSLMRATTADPGDGMAWARLAEIQLGMGEGQEALAAAERASQLLPTLSRVQMVRGFSLLTRGRIDDALVAFQAAVAQDSADPLPRLGLGLAQIRQGDLAGGRHNIEIAAALDPANALIRSYLGKAYFEEKRDKPAGEQLQMAKRFDPLDPTPYLYDAIRKQTQNRPVEALRDIQQSIALNDNRAIYRSRLMLDDDLAVRDASLGRIFSDLGFESLALIEGIRSLETAPADPSGHRLLADAFRAQPRHEIARANELMQSGLLQPLIINPLQPSLAETNLFLREGAAATRLSMGEYSPMFQRNRVALQVHGTLGEHETKGGEIMGAALWNPVSANVAHFQYETDGLRENNDHTLEVTHALGQVMISPATSVLAEARHLEDKRGDLDLRFTGEYDPLLRQRDVVDSFRVGLRHDVSPQATLMAFTEYQQGELESAWDPVSIVSDVDFYTGEVRYIYRTPRLHLSAGGGHQYLDAQETLQFFGSPQRRAFDRRFTNAYLYADFALAPSLRFSLGASESLLEGESGSEDKNQFNPKVGLTWLLLPSTSIKAAAFRTLQGLQISERSLNPSLEPTQVAGFNQFFFGVEGDDAWRYGIGLDHKFSRTLFAGVEISERDLETRFFTESEAGSELQTRDWKERVSRAYLNWAPLDWLAGSIDFLHETFDHGGEAGPPGWEKFTELKTDRIPIAVRLFHPLGFEVMTRGTYVMQRGTFTIPLDGGADQGLRDDRDRFWVFDAAFAYRLPKRFGMVSVEARNLLDRSFHFQDTDPGNPRIMPERDVLLKLSLAF